MSGMTGRVSGYGCYYTLLVYSVGMHLCQVGSELTFVPTKALVRVDLPALGAPTTPTCNSCCCSVETAGVSGLHGSGTYSVTCSSSSTASSQAGKLLYTRCKSCCGVVCLQLCGRLRPAHDTSARYLAKSFKLVSAHTRGRLPPAPVAKAEHSVKLIFASMERAIFRTDSSRAAFSDFRAAETPVRAHVKSASTAYFQSVGLGTQVDAGVTDGRLASQLTY